ncbi:MAG TPA: DUF397 domain-containing protein [Candidatus Limnocylindria bacterium]|nr:DUF397 domain-containing protein [Candidatus Limnocylindria bacterium]
MKNKRELKPFSFKVNDGDFNNYTNPGGIINRCIAVAIKPRGVAIRDSKRNDSPTLFFRHSEWKSFVSFVKRMS